MRIDMAEDGSLDISIRQSWLSNARDCLEKGRQLLTIDSISSDLAAIGTAVHAGAEVACRDGQASGVDVMDAAVEEWRRIVAEEPIRWTKHTEITGRAEVAALAMSWHRNLRQHVTSPRFVEEEFAVQFDEFTHGDRPVRIHLTGTIDLVQFDAIWDWKTSSRRWAAHEKQSESIQASIYSAAAVANGWLTYPLTFSFGVLLRGTDKAQVVEVQRTAAHTEWLRQQIRSTVRMALTVGTDVPWPVNDTGGLCSPMWCEAWSNCKGAYLAPVDPPRRTK